MLASANHSSSQDLNGRGTAGGLEVNTRDEENGPTNQGGGNSGCDASATGVSLGPSTDHNDGTRYGLITPINVRGTNLADVQDSELVGMSTNHTGSFQEKPATRGNNSGFMAADNIPADRHFSGVADHLSYFDNHGGEGTNENQQMDFYKIPQCGINDAQDMSNSGYRIKRHIWQEGNKIYGQMTKTAEAVDIDGHRFTPGLTPQRQPAPLVLRTL